MRKIMIAASSLALLCALPAAAAPPDDPAPPKGQAPVDPEPADPFPDDPLPPGTAPIGLCFYGCPDSPPGNDMVEREIYILSNNPETKLADWVSYYLDDILVGSGSAGSRDYRPDPRLDPGRTLEPADYKGAFNKHRYTKGHQAPRGSFKGIGQSRDADVLSNITPQKEDLNTGSWHQLELAVRELAGKTPLYVVTGPLYEQPLPSLPRADEPHQVPSGYWKIIATEAGIGSFELAAFVFGQDTAKDADFCDHRTTVDEIERRTGLDFHHQLDDATEERLEGAAGALAAERLGCE